MEAKEIFNNNRNTPEQKQLKTAKRSHCPVWNTPVLPSAVLMRDRECSMGGWRLQDGQQHRPVQEGSVLYVFSGVGNGAVSQV